MDTIDNFDENVLESSVQTSNLIDVGIEAVDGLQHLKYSDDGDTSLEENETATNDEDVSLKEQMSENDNVLTHDGAHKIKAVNDCVIETSLNGTEESLPVIPSTAIISFEGCSIMPPDDNFLETTISNENLLKPSLDDENNSDMQDEEIQLRWDDDDVEEITFNSGIEEVYYNTAHFIKNKTSTGEGDDEAFSLQKVKIEEPHDMDVTNVEYLKDEDSELNESPKINLNFETEHQQDIETVENEIKDFAFDSLENKESSKVNLYSKDLEEFLILKQKPIGTGIDAANILEDIQLELSNDIKIDTVVAKDCHGLQEKKIDLVDEEKNIILEGIGLVESIDVNLDSNNTDNYNFYHNVKEKLTCDGDEGETPLKTVNTDTSNDKESNFEIEITKFSNNIIAKETNDDNMEINQLPKINLVNERPEEFNKISYCTKPLNDIEISMVKLGDDEQKQINNTIQYNNEKQNDTEDEVKGDLTESMKIPESTEIKWDNSPEYGAMEGTDTSEDKQPNELNDITYCAKPLNENEISMVNLGDDDEKQFNNTIQPKNTEDEVRGDSKESIKPQESTGINQGNSPDHGEIEKTSTSEKEVPHELNDFTYSTKSFNENEISIVNLGDDDEKQFDNTIQCINEIPKNTEDEVIGESTKSVKTQESTEMNCGISPKYGAIKGTSTSDTEDKQSHEKGAELNLSPKHSIKKIHTELSTEENITIVPTFKKQAGDDSALQDSIVDTSMGIVTQHGLKKPDMMLEIPTKELMNFMDEDDDNLDLLGNLEMSPDYAGVESAKLEDNIKEVNDPETVSTVPIISNNLDKEMNTVANMSEKIVDTRETSNENVNTDDNTAVKNQMVQLPNIPIVVDAPQPSTSKACMVLEMSRDSDEIGEVSDSLGLLAESSRVLEYDEEQDDDEDVDDDEDFDQDEESNQMLTEYSEESNTVHFESDMPKILQMESDNAQDGGEKENIERYDSEKETELCGFQIFEIKSDIPVNINENLIENNKQTECSLVIPKQEKTNVDENKEGMDDEMVPSPAVEQTTEKNLDAPPERLLSNTSDKEDENKTAKLPLENEDDADLKNNMSIGPPNDLAEVVEEKEKGEDDDVVLLDSSSDEDSCHSNEKSSSLSGVEPTVTSDDVSRCSLLTEVIEKPSSDSNLENSKLENRKIELTVTSEKKVTKTPTGLELFNVDSDDDETRPKSEHSELEECVWEDEEPRELTPCVNLNCNSKSDTQYYVADYEVCKFYQADHNGAVVCGPCADYVVKKSEEMIEAIRTFVPLLEMETGKLNKDLVEISDSDTDDDDGAENDGREKIGEIGAKFLEEKLGDMINETWVKFKMQSRFDDALLDLQKDLDVVNAEGEDLDGMLTECQQELDQIRTEFYATFNQERKDLPAIVIYDTPKLTYSSYEDVANSKAEPPQVRMKRRMSAVTDTPAKRLASLPALHYEDELDMTEYTPAASPESVDDDNVDVSVVDMSLETAPADLPPPGDYVKPLLRVGMTVYAMRTTYGLWTKAKIVELYPKTSWESSFTMCRVRFEHKVARNPFKFLPARCLAYSEPTEFRLIIATRIVASSDTTDTFYSGVVAEVPSPVNGYRYLVFFDDGHAKYVRHANTRLVCECSSLVWEEVHPNSREFVRNYLISYPERPMVRLHAGQNLKTEWNNQWWNSRVMQVDASLALIMLAGDRMEWIYRGSTRLAPLYLEMQAAERHRARPMPRSGHQYRTNMPYVEYTRYDEQQSVKAPAAATPQQNEEIRRQRAVAKKSLTTSQTVPPARPTPPANAANAANNMDSSRVVYYTPKNAVRPYKMVPHQCGPKCKRTDVLALKDLRTYNPLAKPLLSGWERQIVRFKGHREVMYRAPCGRRVRNMPELHRYLRAVRSDMSVDLFDFGPGTHCLAEFVINKCLVGKKDLSHGKENVPVPCVNYYDKTLPEFCSYNTERTPTAGVPLNLDPEFLCGCDCDDDCQDKNKCACWKMTLEGARTIGLNGDVGYVYRRLPEPLPSGIYECNSRCKCKNTCLNRVAQHPLQLKLQVFKTMNRGWGIRALNDVPKGAFLCVYAGNLLTDATANLDGLNEGDEYLAELDYIEVVEQMKEGYEDDIPDSLKEPDKSTSESTEEEESSSSGEEEAKVSKDEIDDDFQPGYIDVRPVEFNKRLRTRNRRKKEKQNNPDKDKDKDETQEKEKMKEEREKENGEEDCITISDDEEVREPSRFMAQAGMDSKQLISKHRSVRSYFGKDEACYIMDAKVQGNIGRYLNHSCCPNVFVQNVFVDTHDPRFPWVAFFALSYIRAGTELTWNYNYDVGSVPGKVLYCYCGAANCRGRLL